jgi:hypothetical protein
MASYPKGTVGKVQTHFEGSERFGEPLKLMKGWQRKTILARTEQELSTADHLMALHESEVEEGAVLGVYP